MRLTRRLLLGLMLSTVCGSAHADGCHFPAEAYVDVAGIPAQRALVSFRDGTETLILESAFSSDSPEVAWVVPLPARPTGLEPVPAGALKTLPLSLSPRVVHREFHGYAWLATAAWIIVFLSLLTLTARPYDHPVFRLAYHALVVGFVLFVVGAFFLPALGRAGRGAAVSATPGAGIAEDIVDVGSYRVHVLTPETPDQLDDWLDANGFAAVPQDGRKIVLDYIADGWCFLAAKLPRDTPGTSVPHPIQIVFPADRAVYPMRLTALANSTTRLELTVVGDAGARCPALDTVLTDTFSLEQMSDPPGGEGGVEHRPEFAYCGRRFGRWIAQEALFPVFWHGCVVTQLSGELRPREMRHDLVFNWGAPDPYQRTVYSSDAAKAVALTVFSAGLLALMVLTVVRFARYLTRPRGVRNYVVRIVPLLAGTMLIVALVVLLGWPTVPIVQRSRLRARLFQRHAVQIVEMVGYEQDLTADTEPRRIRELVTEVLSQSDLVNPYTGRAPQEEASPGNYTIRTDGGEALVSIYRANGSRTVIDMTMGQ
ncbi:MAG: DUF2330 domain-containing protein [Planctomycetota bacterium]